MPTYYINADSGNDTTGDGSSSLPWKTISKAHTSAASGDTIICQNSTATYTFGNQTFTKSLTIQGQKDDASGAVFDAAGGAARWTCNANLTVKKITFRNSQLSTDNFGGVLVAGASGITLTASQCIFYNIDFATLLPNSYAANIISLGQILATGTIAVSNCIFYDISRPIVAAGQIGIIGGNSITTITLTVIDTIFYSNEATNPINYFVGYSGATTANVIVRNCIIMDALSGSIVSVQSGSTVSYNCYSGVTDAGGTGSITSDPLFVDPANGNFNLRPTSPCRWVGT